LRDLANKIALTARIDFCEESKDRSFDSKKKGKVFEKIE
jgi:RNA processing factor Prp31